MIARMTALGVGGLLAAQAVVYVVLLGHEDLTHFGQAQVLLAAVAPTWLISVWLMSRLRTSRRAAVWLVLGAGAVLQLAAVVHAPSTSDDDYRYMWDAKVQLAGVDPYRYAPAAPQLAHLRTASLFGAPAHCLHAFAGGCTSINRPTDHTIYPPVAQAAFDVMRLISFGGHGNHLPLQLFAAVGTLLVGWLVLRRSGDRPWRAALWAWSPIAVIEYGNNAHIDWLAVLFVVLALNRRRVIAAGALVGAAIAVKIYPVLVLPALMRRSWWAAVAAVTVVVLVYVPHLVAAGSSVVGYLPGYLNEEGYRSGGRLLLLGSVLPHPVDTIVGVLAVAGVAVWALSARLRSRGSVENVAVIVVGVAFLAFSPSYGWYAGLLLVLVALSGAVEWVPVVLAPSVVYLIHVRTNTARWDATAYAIALVLTLAFAAYRHPDNLRACLRSISNGTGRSRSSVSTRRR